LTLIIALVIAAKMVLTKNFIVEKLERKINCRVEIGDLDISIFSPTARVQLNDVKLGLRDSLADDKMPHDDRPKLEGDKVQVSMESVKLNVSLLGVIFKNVDVKGVQIDKAHAKAMWKEEGGTSLDSMFAKPKTDKEEAGDSFNIFENQNFVTNLHAFELTNTTADLLIESSMLKVALSDINLSIQDTLKIDPNQLDMVNEAKAQLAGTMVMTSTRQDNAHYGKISIDGELTAKLFNPETGDFDPNAVADLSISSDSYITGKVPALHKWGQMSLAALSKLGLSEKVIPEKIFFGGTRKLACKYFESQIELNDQLALTMGNWEGGLEAGSWFKLDKNTHYFKWLLIASPSASEKSKNFVAKSFRYIPKKEVQDLAIAEFAKLWFKNGRLAVRVDTSESLSSPKAKLINELPDLKKIGGELFDGFKGDLLDKGKKKLLDKLFGE